MVNRQRITAGLLIVLVMLSILHRSADAVTIDMVTVGNPGNAPDTEVMIQDGTSGYGSVDHVYQIGKYEGTAGQYTEFLNAVAKADPNSLFNTAMGSIPSLGANIQRGGASPNYSYNVAADWANRPVNYVSFWDAARFANWLHNGQPLGPQGPGTTEGGAYLNVGNQTTFARQPGARFSRNGTKRRRRVRRVVGRGGGFTGSSGVQQASLREDFGPQFAGSDMGFRIASNIPCCFYALEVWRCCGARKGR